MTNILTIKDLNTTVNHEPRLHDLLVAERLGFARPRKIRETIERNRSELEQHGTLTALRGAAPPHGGAGVDEYYLNEAQALLVCMFSRTAKAAEVRKAVIEVYQAYRAGTLAPAPTTAPAPAPAPATGMFGKPMRVPLHRFDNTGDGLMKIGSVQVAFDQLMPLEGAFDAVVIDEEGRLAVRRVTAPGYLTTRPRQVNTLPEKKGGGMASNHLTFIGRVSKNTIGEVTV